MQICAMLLAAFTLQTGALSFSAHPAELQIVSFMEGEAVTMPGGAPAFEPGDPHLPGVTYSLVLPQGEQLVDVEVEVLSSVELPGVHEIAPIVAQPLSQPVPAAACRSDAYGSGTFPDCLVRSIYTGTKTGFRIGTFCFTPVSWDQDTGRLHLVTEARLTPVIAADPDAPVLQLSELQIQTAMRGLEVVVENPGMLGEYAPPESGVRGTPWVVVADEAHQETLQPLTDLRETTHGASFVSTQWVYASYDGRDSQEQIRNYLKDAYENDGLVYALIVGDYGETTRLSSLTLGGNTMNATSDLYYSDLDGDWDLDGDSLFGELGDGVDYYSDIYTGRFSTDVPSRLQTMVEKAVAYETAAPEGPWSTTALLAGAGLWVDDPPGYWGSFVCDSIDTRIPDSWTVHKLYEDYESHPDNQMELYNQGVSYSSVNGHGNASGIYWYYPPSTGIVTSSNYSELTNQDMPIVFHSIACHPGHLENIACIAERLMFWPDGGAIAVMFNAHWGIGTPPAFGPSEWLELYFADVLFAQQQYELGVAHALSKDQYWAGVSITWQRWIMQENNYLGDPALRFVAGQTGVGGGGSGQDPRRLALGAPHPNPASESCAIGYSSPETVRARLVVYDMAGRVVSEAFSGELAAGEGALGLDVSRLPSGCYRAVLESPGGTVSSPLLVLR
jgi:hypothetical protein